MSNKPLYKALAIFSGTILALIATYFAISFAQYRWRYARQPGPIPSELPTTLDQDSFLSWCEHKNELAKETQITIEVILAQRETQDCQSASEELASLNKLVIISNSGYPKPAIQCLTGYCTDYRIYDLRPLASLNNLEQLILENHKLKDIAPLARMTNLKVLMLIAQDVNTDISAVQSLENLQSLFLSVEGEGVNLDLQPLQSLENLRGLILFVEGEGVNLDLQPLQSLENLTTLSIGTTSLCDLNLLSSSKSLESLSLSCAQVNNLASLRSLSKLEHLSLTESNIADISTLPPLKNLKGIDLSNNQISDISHLENFPNLEHINLERNQISNIAPLQSLPKLWILNLRFNQVVDISAIEEVEGLAIELEGNPIADES